MKNFRLGSATLAAAIAGAAPSSALTILREFQGTLTGGGGVIWYAPVVERAEYRVFYEFSAPVTVSASEAYDGYRYNYDYQHNLISANNFGGGGNLGSFSTSDEGSIEFSGTNFHVRLLQPNRFTDFYFDERIFNLGFTPSSAQTSYTYRLRVAGVPEQKTWALMISGFGLAGAALRSQRRRIVPDA